jgi:hypothetical protein
VERPRVHGPSSTSASPNLNLHPRALDLIELIDVLWLRGDTIVKAFEIEHTTSVFSGILRMSDLVALQPNLSIPLYIVAPDERRQKVIRELNRPTFPGASSAAGRHLSLPVVLQSQDPGRAGAIVRAVPPARVPR